MNSAAKFRKRCRSSSSSAALVARRQTSCWATRSTSTKALWSDTHVQRLSRRLGLTREADAVAIEQALIPLFPRDSWTMLSHLLIWHGRRVCHARKPLCGDCVLNDVCPSAGVA
jgi:endonuclease-3